MFGHMVPHLKIDILMTSQTESDSPRFLLIRGGSNRHIGTLRKVASRGHLNKGKKQTLMDKHHFLATQSTIQKS